MKEKELELELELAFKTLNLINMNKEKLKTVSPENRRKAIITELKIPEDILLKIENIYENHRKEIDKLLEGAKCHGY